jgi:CBS domain-containing protein
MANATTVREVMTKNPVTLSDTAVIAEAARAMRDSKIGVVLVNDDNDELEGLITDRDIVVRAIADGKDPQQTPVKGILSHPKHQLEPNASIDSAVKMMSESNVRRIPVIENNRCVGIVSLGDLAIERDPKSALGRISSAPPNN